MNDDKRTIIPPPPATTNISWIIADQVETELYGDEQELFCILDIERAYNRIGSKKND
jgi:hypothetical protein